MDQALVHRHPRDVGFTAHHSPARLLLGFWPIGLSENGLSGNVRFRPKADIRSRPRRIVLDPIVLGEGQLNPTANRRRRAISALLGAMATVTSISAIGQATGRVYRVAWTDMRARGPGVEIPNRRWFEPFRRRLADRDSSKGATLTYESLRSIRSSKLESSESATQLHGSRT